MNILRHSGELTHKQEVTRLYRALLRNTRDWNYNLDEFEKHAWEVHQAFRKNMHVQDPREAEKLVWEGHKYLRANLHPLPYVNIHAPGGSSWERNFPFPERVCISMMFYFLTIPSAVAKVSLRRYHKISRTIQEATEGESDSSTSDSVDAPSSIYSWRTYKYQTYIEEGEGDILLRKSMDSITFSKEQHLLDCLLYRELRHFVHRLASGIKQKRNSREQLYYDPKAKADD
ncbi:NADH dehydrogenase [Planoprotostelium fungivorum]|uniref:NADH dehydrogenase [ubiquinone] 1 beta subcomplex subunit 9 n=1 Tax=Planoprotostelium fungivorum TaxID=1890364 RepID=A0A2P6NSI3_9EUKA|nr:NADH dehydrogenase [Planoprotostelium fungivorum]